MAVVYCLPRKLTPKAFSTESAEESSFPFFPPFFYKQNNACRGSDFAFAYSYDAVANESAADAVCRYARLSTRDRRTIYRNSLFHAILQRLPRNATFAQLRE